VSSIFPNFALPNQSSYTNEWRVGSITRYWPPIHWCPVHAPSYVSQSTFTHLSQEPTNSFSHQTNNITVGPDSALALLNILPLDLTCFFAAPFSSKAIPTIQVNWQVGPSATLWPSVSLFIEGQLIKSPLLALQHDPTVSHARLNAFKHLDSILDSPIALRNGPSHPHPPLSHVKDHM